MHYKIVIAYDGTDYAGWQVQTHKRTITNVMQDCFKQLFGHEIKLAGASRTDAGVHALGQVASFKTSIEQDADKIIFAWNNLLPNDIVIRSIEPVLEEFNSRYDVTEKTYWFHFFLKRPLPFTQRYGYYCYYDVDMEKLKHALQLFVGTHDFRSFTATDKENTVRTIDSISVDFNEQLQAHRIIIKGRSFLQHMIRRIVGACLEVASKQEVSVDLLKNVLDEKNPNQAVLKAPAKGLLLYDINYK